MWRITIWLAAGWVGGASAARADLGQTSAPPQLQGPLLNTTVTHDATSELTTGTYPGNVQVLTYRYLDGPAKGKMWKQVRVIGDQTLVTYLAQFDDAGKLTEYSRNGSLYTFTKDAQGHIAQVLKDGNWFATQTYDTGGRLLTVTQADGMNTTYTYQEDGTQVRSLHTPTGRVLTFEPNRTISTERDGTQTITYDYPDGPAKGKPWKNERVKDGKTEVTFEAKYDAAGNLVEEHQNGSVFTYQFDANGRKTEAYRDGVLFSKQTYDDTGRIQTTQIVDGENITYNYPDNGPAEKTVQQPDGRTATYILSDSGGIAAVKKPDGTSKPVRAGGPAGSPVAPRQQDAAAREARAQAELAEAKATPDTDIDHRTSLILSAAALYTSPQYTPEDPWQAVKVAQMALDDPKTTALGRAQAHNVAAFAATREGTDEGKTLALWHLDALYESKSDGLKPEKQEAMEQERAAGVNLMMELTTTRDRTLDEAYWAKWVEDHGNTPAMTAALRAHVAELNGALGQNVLM